MIKNTWHFNFNEWKSQKTSHFGLLLYKIFWKCGSQLFIDPSKDKMTILRNEYYMKCNVKFAMYCRSFLLFLVLGVLTCLPICSSDVDVQLSAKSFLLVCKLWICCPTWFCVDYLVPSTSPSFFSFIMSSFLCLVYGSCSLHPPLFSFQKVYGLPFYSMYSFPQLLIFFLLRF